MCLKSHLFASLYLKLPAPEQLLQLLRKYKPDLEVSGNEPLLEFNLAGVEFVDVRDGLLAGALPYLDPDRRSCLLFRSSDGLLHTLLVLGGKVVGG